MFTALAVAFGFFWLLARKPLTHFLLTAWLTAIVWELAELVNANDGQFAERNRLLAAYSTAMKFGALRASRKEGDRHASAFLEKRLLEVALPMQFRKDFNLERWGRQFDKGAAPDSIWGGLVSSEVMTK